MFIGLGGGVHLSGDQTTKQPINMTPPPPKPWQHKAWGRRKKIALKPLKISLSVQGLNVKKKRNAQEKLGENRDFVASKLGLGKRSNLHHPLSWKARDHPRVWVSAQSARNSLGNAFRRPNLRGSATTHLFLVLQTPPRGAAANFDPAGRSNPQDRWEALRGGVRTPR